MMATTPEALCPVCGTTVPPAAPEGLCPRCLAFAAVELPGEANLASFGQVKPFAAGRFFGDYELLDEIARGGMGIVFRARQLGVNRIVALKVLAGGAAAGREFVHRFHNEAAAAARLEHPNIVPIYEFGEHEGAHFLAMRFLEGGTLQTCIARGLPTPAQAAHTVRSIAEAVEHAHRRGVLHRDLKPGNVLLDAEGAPHVADFGLARLLDSDDSLTLSRAVIGTAAYLAPEVAAAGAGCTTTASDIYGLGAILYELLTGRPPFVGVTLAATLRAVHGEEPARPSKTQPAVAGDLEIICLKCLEKEPTKRYASAQELADDLDRFLKQEPIRARSVTPIERGWRWCRRKPALASSFALVLVLVLVVAIGAPIAVYRTNRARADAERSLYAADMKLASQAVRDGAVDHARDLLVRHRPKQGDADLRGFEWRYLWRTTEQREVMQALAGLPSPNTPENRESLARAGDLLYNLDYRERLQVWNMIDWTPLPSRLPSERVFDRWFWHPNQQAALGMDKTRRTLTFFQLPSFLPGQIIPLRGIATYTAISPDHRFLAVCVQDGDRQQVSIGDLLEKAEQVVLGEFSAHVSQLEFSNNGKVLAVPSADGVISLWDLTTSKPIPGPRLNVNSETFVRFAPTGSRFVYWNVLTDNIGLWDPIAGEYSLARAVNGSQFRFSPDGELLAGVWESSDVATLFEIKSNRRVGTLRGHQAGITTLAFSPDGNLLATASMDRTARVWDLKTERELATLGGHADSVYGVVFSADGEQLITIAANGAGKVWDLRQVMGRNLLLKNSTRNWWLRMSADERLLASADTEGTIHVWDHLSRRETHTVRTGSSALIGLTVEPQGNRLAWASATSLGFLDLRSGRTNTIPIVGNHGMFVGISFSPDNQEIIFGSSMNVLRYELATSRLRPFAHCEAEVFSIAYSPDGSRLAFGHDGGAVSLWDRESGRKLSEVPAHAELTAMVEFSRDGKWLASCGTLTIQLWHVERDGLKPAGKPLRGHAGYVPSIAFSPDGTRLVSASSDHTLKLWDTAGGGELGTLYGHRGWVSGVTYSNDGRRIYSTGEDGDVREWEALTLAETDFPTENIPRGYRPARSNELK